MNVVSAMEFAQSPSKMYSRSKVEMHVIQMDIKRAVAKFAKKKTWKHSLLHKQLHMVEI